jgi:hypothetical protein
MFAKWKKLYEDDELDEFNSNESGLLWLKIKSILRKELLDEFLLREKINLTETKLDEKFIKLYDLMIENLDDSHKKLNDFIRYKNTEQVKNLDVEKLVSELYKLRHFDWGGDYKNALDKFLVDRYIKVYQNFDELCSKFDTEIFRDVQKYVLCSWYNHWSAILIEHLFKNHSIVLPTVGQIKKVDFFINEIPFDLKVTYLPTEYLMSMREKKYVSEAYNLALNYSEKHNLDFHINKPISEKVRKKEVKSFIKSLSKVKPKTEDLKSFLKSVKETLAKCVELTCLKSKAKEVKIKFDEQAKPADIFYEITEKMRDGNGEACLSFLDSLRSEKLEILKESQDNPKILAKWLYENQGEMRFGAENRLFLILVDTEDFDNSWKLKRNLDLLKPSIEKYLDNFNQKNLDDLKISFKYKDNDYNALSDIIFVVK